MSVDLKSRILLMARDDLDAIEKALLENIDPYIDRVREIAGHILFGGGKRVRPLLMILCARLCGYSGSDDKKVSAMFEYLHAATLLHDDVVDGARMRRGKPVAHEVWDSASAVLVGDFLLARSASIAVGTGRPLLMEILAGVLEQMSQGEIHQLMRKGSADISEEEYRNIIYRKTAALMEGSCRCGAILADACDDEVDALGEYGTNLGLAFQMTDDLLDYTADTSVLGKMVGADLREGKFTLPLIYTLSVANPDDSDFIMRIMKDRNPTPSEFDALKGLLETYGGISYTRRCAEALVKKAKDALAPFPACDAKTLLEMLADYTVSRDW
ncbi:MAG: polyprenyl synthetase [Desulfococcus sp. 4484_241]|nr:MAG: polyprenyl synthetase [Desulfococcus sp. 4484_241]